MVGPDGRRQGLTAALLWTALATVLFLGFGYAVGQAVTGTLLALGALEPASEPLLLEVVRCLTGVILLGVSSLYRRLAGVENAGSLAAWLAGWALVASQGALLASRVSGSLAVGLLLAALALWAAVHGFRLWHGRRRPG